MLFRTRGNTDTVKAFICSTYQRWSQSRSAGVWILCRSRNKSHCFSFEPKQEHDPEPTGLSCSQPKFVKELLKFM